MYGALQAGPEVLNTVAVDVPVYVLFQVVHDFMVVQEVHAPLFAVLIGIDVRPGVNVLFDNRLNGAFGAILYHGSPNGLAALQDAQHHGFSASVAAFGLRARLAVLVHVSRLTADEGFINFDFAADLAAVVLILHCGPIRWSRNHAVFWVTPMARPTSQLLIPFLEFTTCHMAINHLSRPMGESSMMVPVFRVNCGASCFSRQCQRLHFSSFERPPSPLRRTPRFRHHEMPATAPMKPAPALILFDIAGTLIRRAGPHHRQALVDAVRRVIGLATSTDHIPVHGMLDPDILTRMLRDAGASPAAIRRAMPEIVRRAQQIYVRSVPNLQRKTCPGVRALLRRLQHRGVLLGLVTGNLTRIGWKKLDRAALKPYFRFGAFGEMAKDG